MKNCTAPENKTPHRIVLSGYATALAAAFTMSLPQFAYANQVTAPPVPENIQVPAGNKAFLKGHADGTQNYLCAPCPNAVTSACPVDADFAWILFTPQATLFKDKDQQVTTHFFSPILQGHPRSPARPRLGSRPPGCAAWGPALYDAG